MAVNMKQEVNSSQLPVQIAQEACPQLPGTILRVFIPAGAVIDLLGLVEISSPGGICLIIRLPILGGLTGFDLLTNSIKAAGGTVEIVKN